MPMRLKKLIGTILLVLLVMVYAILAMLYAEANLRDAGPAANLTFFFFSGLLWILPAMAIIKFLMLPPRRKR